MEENKVQGSEQANNITVSDLSNIRAIIDLATTRGAFRTSEMSSIGPVYDKLNAFLNLIEQQAAAAKQQESEKADSAEAE